mmetsp:Transcript_8617/g.26463  ORF Transcript_8617/g.26463 Transcript_8617/m.26463 type:complete len:218 (-) Transcript_8617:524-1177(-)
MRGGRGFGSAMGTGVTVKLKRFSDVATRPARTSWRNQVKRVLVALIWLSSWLRVPTSKTRSSVGTSPSPRRQTQQIATQVPSTRLGLQTSRPTASRRRRHLGLMSGATTLDRMYCTSRTFMSLRLRLLISTSTTARQPSSRPGSFNLMPTSTCALTSLPFFRQRLSSEATITSGSSLGTPPSSLHAHCCSANVGSTIAWPPIPRFLRYASHDPSSRL